MAKRKTPQRRYPEQDPRIARENDIRARSISTEYNPQPSPSRCNTMLILILLGTGATFASLTFLATKMGTDKTLFVDQNQAKIPKSAPLANQYNQNNRTASYTTNASSANISTLAPTANNPTGFWNASTGSPAIPQQQRHIKVNELAEQIAPRIERSAKLKANPQYTEAAFRKDVNLFHNALIQISKDKVLACKLASVLEDTNFTFKIVESDELNSMEIAHFVSNPKPGLTPFLAVPRTEITSKSLENTLRHEIEHAFVQRQNNLNGRLFFNTQQSSCACTPNSDGKTYDCAQLIAMINSAPKRIQRIVDILNINPRSLNAQDKRLVQQYKALAKGYKPKIFTQPVKISQQQLQQANLVDRNLNIVAPPELMQQYVGDQFVRGDIHPRIVGYERDGAIYHFQLMTCPEGDPKAAAYDICFEFMSALEVYGKQHAGILYTELDATMHSLGMSPELLDLFLPDLEEYHTSRSDQSYQECVAAP
jgi:hypothetical protein